MADNITGIAQSHPTERAQVESGLREWLAENGKDIPQDFVDLVNLITATAVEYGANLDDVGGHQKKGVRYSLLTKICYHC